MPDAESVHVQDQHPAAPRTGADEEPSERLALALSAKQPRFYEPRDHQKDDSRALRFCLQPRRNRRRWGGDYGFQGFDEDPFRTTIPRARPSRPDGREERT